jgi:hypothetical protein
VTATASSRGRAAGAAKSNVETVRHGVAKATNSRPAKATRRVAKDAIQVDFDKRGAAYIGLKPGRTRALIAAMATGGATAALTYRLLRSGGEE